MGSVQEISRALAGRPSSIPTLLTLAAAIAEVRAIEAISSMGRYGTNKRTARAVGGSLPAMQPLLVAADPHRCVEELAEARLGLVGERIAIWLEQARAISPAPRAAVIEVPL